MIAKLLEQLGLHLGWVLQENSEALFFVERNERLMNACGGSWEFPESALNLMDNPSMRAIAARQLEADMDSYRFWSFLGPKHWGSGGSLKGINFPWGWKDPRNSFLLPIWLDLFPNARVVHIYRHPLDVAISLQVREQRSLNDRVARLSRTAAIKVHSTAQGAKAIKESPLLYIYRRCLAAQSRFAPLRAYNKLEVSGCLSLEFGIRLWKAYVAKCFEADTLAPSRCLHVKYEDFLTAPAPQLDTLRQFCALPGSTTDVENVCKNVRTERRYAFRTHQVPPELLKSLSQDPLVQRCGYADSFAEHSQAVRT